MELLVVIVIIGILASILIPMISKMQKTAKAADTQAFITQLSSAITAYEQDHHAPPGPLTNQEVSSSLGTGGMAPAITAVAGQTLTPTKITMAENLALGLLGALRVTSAPGVQPVTMSFDKDLMLNAKGPSGLNAARPKMYKGYLAASNLSEGKFTDAVGAANDSEIPEFLDRFTPNPMPILYLRAIKGRRPAAATAASNRVITDGTTRGTPNEGPYDITQITPYTDTPIGVGKSLDARYEGSADDPKTDKSKFDHGLRTVEVPLRAISPTPTAQGGTYTGSNYYVPFDALAYFRNPTTCTVADPNTWAPREADGFILISAGKDRVYGTPDDITNFGSVTP